MDKDYSRDGMLGFLREAVHAGLINPAVARSRRNAALELFAHLSEAEAEDLRRVDVDELAARCHKLQGGTVRPEVLSLYAGRLREALDDYFRYREAPDSFVARRTERQPPRRRGSEQSRSAEDEALEQLRLEETRYRPDIVPIPLRPGTVLYLHGVPADLSAAEARKVARVVEALAGEPASGE
ncbi:MAG: hypothetical protein ACX93N_00355 [Pseudohaliea sp.]